MTDTTPAPTPPEPRVIPPAAAPQPGTAPGQAAPQDPSPAAVLGRKAFKRVIANPLGKLAGVVVGAVIGLAVQAGAQSTGVLGPGLDAVLDQQAQGFALLETKLESLSKAETIEQARSIAKDIESQAAEMRSNSQRLDDELRGARAEIERLRADTLNTTGVAAGADVWLKPGESITVGERGNTFALLGYSYSGRTNDISVNANATKQRLVVGDSVAFPVADGQYTVVFKQSEARPDGRIGFDVVKGPKPG